MILSGVEFVVIFAVVFGACLLIARARAAALEARQERDAWRARQRLLAEAKSNDMWRANKRMTMR
jgi:hypothetical protein